MDATILICNFKKCSLCKNLVEVTRSSTFHLQVSLTLSIYHNGDLKQKHPVILTVYTRVQAWLGAMLLSRSSRAESGTSLPSFSISSHWQNRCKNRIFLKIIIGWTIKYCPINLTWMGGAYIVTNGKHIALS